MRTYTHIFRLLTAVAASLCFTQAAFAAGFYADIVLTNGKVYTAEKKQPWAESIAVKDKKILYVGSTQGIKGYIGPGTEKFDLAGKLVLPGIVDSHTHPGYVARTADSLELPIDVKSVEEILDVVASYARSNPDKALISGGYWPATLFGIEGPKKELLDSVVSDRPVVLIDDTSHSRWLNSTALEILGIDRNTPDPVPGLSYFYRDNKGDPTGWVMELGIDEALGALGALGHTDKSVVEQLLQYYVSMGVTTIFDAGNLGLEDDAYGVVSSLEKEGKLPLRYEASHVVYLPDQLPTAITALKNLRAKYGGKRLRFNTIKIFMDGIHEARTSSVLEPFISEGPNGSRARGATMLNKEQLHDFILKLNEEGINLHIHVVGDRTTRVVLDAVESAQNTIGSLLSMSVTLAHLDFVDEGDFQRFRELDVFANFTPHWHGGYWQGAQPHVGVERYEKFFRPNSLDKLGAKITLSTDQYHIDGWKKGRASPYLGIEIGHTRIDPEATGKNEVRPPHSETLSIEKLVNGFTIMGARQLKLDSILGSIRKGKLADLVVLNENLFELEPQYIGRLKPVAVLMEGKIVSGVLQPGS